MQVFLRLRDLYCTVKLPSNTSLCTFLLEITKILRDYKESIPLLLLIEIPYLQWKDL